MVLGPPEAGDNRIGKREERKEVNRLSDWVREKHEEQPEMVGQAWETGSGM